VIAAALSAAPDLDAFQAGFEVGLFFALVAVVVLGGLAFIRRLLEV
jgi:hypothetical protein